MEILIGVAVVIVFMLSLGVWTGQLLATIADEEWGSVPPTGHPAAPTADASSEQASEPGDDGSPVCHGKGNRATPV